MRKGDLACVQQEARVRQAPIEGVPDDRAVQAPVVGEVHPELVGASGLRLQIDLVAEFGFAPQPPMGSCRTSVHKIDPLAGAFDGIAEHRQLDAAAAASMVPPDLMVQ